MSKSVSIADLSGSRRLNGACRRDVSRRSARKVTQSFIGSGFRTRQFTSERMAVGSGVSRALESSHELIRLRIAGVPQWPPPP